MQDTAQLVAVLLLASFALERINAAAHFALGDEPAEAQKQRRRKVLLFALGGSVALAIVDWGGLRIIERLQPGHSPWPIDYWLTWLVLVAGTDRIKELLAGASGKAKEAKEAGKTLESIRLELDGLKAKA